jgi:hypothetical protein
MSNVTLPIEATQDAITRAAVRTDDLARPPALETEAQPPVLITEQEVMFGTAIAVRPRSIPITRRMVGMLHAVATALRPPPPRPHYAGRAYYLEYAAMSREMDRL